jgi:hypothetical protein
VPVVPLAVFAGLVIIIIAAAAAMNQCTPPTVTPAPTTVAIATPTTGIVTRPLVTPEGVATATPIYTQFAEATNTSTTVPSKTMPPSTPSPIPPEAVELLAPSNDSEQNQRKIRFHWRFDRDLNDNEWFEIRIAKQAHGQSVTVIQALEHEQEFDLSSHPAGDYFWTVVVAQGTPYTADGYVTQPTHWFKLGWYPPLEPTDTSPPTDTPTPVAAGTP